MNNVRKQASIDNAMVFVQPETGEPFGVAERALDPASQAFVNRTIGATCQS